MNESNILTRPNSEPQEPPQLPSTYVVVPGGILIGMLVVALLRWDRMRRRVSGIVGFASARTRSSSIKGSRDPVNL